MSDDEPIRVGILIGNQSDWSVAQQAAIVLGELEVGYEARALSPHRSPHAVCEYAESAAERGLQVIICASGGAAHLAGMVAAHTHLPVLGVPLKGWSTDGLDSLLSTVQMPAGVPVGTLAIGKAGARNAALLAISMLSLSDEALRARYIEYRKAQTQAALAVELPPPSF